MPYPVDGASLEPISSYNRTMTQAQLQTMQELFREEAVSWYSVYNGVASTVTGSQSYSAVVGAALPNGT